MLKILFVCHGNNITMSRKGRKQALLQVLIS